MHTQNHLEHDLLQVHIYLSPSTLLFGYVLPIDDMGHNNEYFHDKTKVLSNNRIYI